MKHMSIKIIFEVLRHKAYYDVALWEVKPVPLGDYIQPICLPDPSSNYSSVKAVKAIGMISKLFGKKCIFHENILETLPGWGSLERSSALENRLRHAFLTVHPDRSVYLVVQIRTKLNSALFFQLLQRELHLLRESGGSP